MIKIEILGKKKLVENAEKLEAARQRLPGEIGKAAFDFGLMAIRTAKLNYLSGPRPEHLDVVTGRLRASVNSKVDKIKDGFQIRVGTDVPYGAIHEFGLPVKRGKKTFRMKARPFITPAVEKSLPFLKNKLNVILGDIGKGLGK